VQWAARGHVRVGGLLRGHDGVLWLCLAPGWHVNGPETGGDLVPTELTLAQPAHGWRLTGIGWPEPVPVRIFDMRLPLYLGRVEIRFRAEPGLGPLPLRFRLQACDEGRCLPPETVGVQVAAED